MARADDLKQRVGKLWQTTVAQIEGVRDTVKARAGSAREQFEKELSRLKSERDKLIVRLGEQTLEWVNKSPVRVPTVVQGTVDRLNDVIGRLTKKPAAKKSAAPAASAKKPSGAAKKSAPKRTVKKTVKKLSAKPARSEAKAPNKSPVVKKPLEV